MKLMKLEKIDIKRRAQDYLLEGHWIKSDLTEFNNIDANVQPLKGTEILQLSEGDRKKRTRLLFTPSFEIKTNDIVMHDDTKYEVQALEVWKGIKLTYSKCLLVKLDDQNESI